MAEKKTTKATVSKKKLKEEIQDGDNQENVTVASPAAEEVATKQEVVKAKAGKRSTKALVEAEEKEAKEERKSETKAKSEKPKQQIKPARSRLERAGKKYKEVAKLVENDREYSLKEAAELAVKTSTTKFDATVELHVNLNVDPKLADQNLRDNLVLPAGTGKTVRIAVLAEADDAEAAKKAGADIAGGEEFLQQLDKNLVNFDLLIATPSMMPKLGKYAKLLGPKGLMPNPKSGTVTTSVVKAVTEAKGGRLEYRVDSTGIIHAGIGKVSFGADKVLENAEAVLNNIKNNKPSSVKGALIKSVYLTTSMGPSVRVALSEMSS